MTGKSPENPPHQGMDYGETEPVHTTHAAVGREKIDPRVGLEPLSLWLLAISGLAVVFGFASLGRYAVHSIVARLDYPRNAPRARRPPRAR